jgi:hypothetical protein
MLGHWERISLQAESVSQYILGRLQEVASGCKFFGESVKTGLWGRTDSEVNHCGIFAYTGGVNGNYLSPRTISQRGKRWQGKRDREREEETEGET